MTGLALVLVAGAVQATDYKVLADRKVDFNLFKTYKIDKVTITRSSGAKVKKANIDSLRAAVVRQLEKEGLTEAKDQDKPDVLVSVLAGVDAGLKPAEMQGEPYFDGTWRILPKVTPAEGTELAEPATYNQATLRIDIRNASNKQIVWRALASDVVRLPVPEQKVNEVLDKAFEQYPPPPAE